MYDVIVIGGGAAGMTAAIYCSRAGLKTAVIEKFPVSGGQMNLTNEVDNYPGIESAEGMQIAAVFRRQAENAGAEFICGTVESISADADKTVCCGEKSYRARAIIYAAGADHRKLGVKGESELAGRGVSYCAVCDGGFFRKKTVAVIGGGDTALKEALYLSRLCERVYLIHRRDSFRGGKYLLDKCEEQENITVLRSTVCTEIRGEKNVNEITLSDGNREYPLKCDGVFVSVGMAPQTALIKDICDTDENGYIIAGENCTTSAAGIFAAGDVRRKYMRQIITACADGANAAHSAEEYISQLP